MSVHEDVIVAFFIDLTRQTHWSNPVHLLSFFKVCQIMNVLRMLTRKTQHKEMIFLNYCKAISKNLEKITQLFQYVKDNVILTSLVTLT